MILVDSCIYINWMREGVNPVERLHPHQTDLVSCSIVHLEVLRGVTDKKIKNYLADYFSLLPQVPLSADLMQEATDLAWTHDRKGIVLPVTDVIIAACALVADATVITQDRHFSRIAGLMVSASL